MFQVVAVILTLIFHKVEQRHIWGVVGYFIIALLQIYCEVCLEFKNWPVFGKARGKNIVVPFSGDVSFILDRKSHKTRIRRCAQQASRILGIIQQAK